MTVDYPYVAAVHQRSQRQILSRGPLPDDLDTDEALIEWWVGELIEAGEIDQSEVQDWTVVVVREPVRGTGSEWPNEAQATAFFGVEPRPRQGFQSPDPQPLKYRVERNDEMLTVVLSAGSGVVTATHHKAGRRITMMQLSGCTSIQLVDDGDRASIFVGFAGESGEATISIRPEFEISVGVGP